MSEVHVLPDERSVLSSSDDLAATLASRICHDLTSPLGAIANGVELLILSGADRSPEMDLISQSVDSANARIRFFRLAYGMAGPQPVGRAEVIRTLAALAQGGRHSYDWSVEGDHPRAEVKAVFLLLQCLESSLPMGGRLRVTREGGTWIVTAEGPRLRTDLPAWSAFNLQSEPLQGSAHVQFTLLSGLLVCLGRPLLLSEISDRIVARF